MFNMSNIMAQVKPSNTVDTIFADALITMTAPLQETFIVDEDKYTFETLVEKFELKDDEAIEIFIKNETTFGGIKMTFRREGEKFDENYYLNGKSEKAVGYYASILGKICVLTDTELPTDLTTDKFIGKSLKAWSEKEYQVYTDKKTGLYKIGCYTNLMFKNPNYDVFAKSAQNKLDADAEFLALTTAPVVTVSKTKAAKAKAKTK